jgi:hypothetical protein
VYNGEGVLLSALGSVTQYEHSGLTAGTVYSYRITSLAGSEESAKTAAVSARTWERLTFNKQYDGTISAGVPHFYRINVTSGLSYTFTSNGASGAVRYESGDAFWFNLNSGTVSQTAGQSGWAYIKFQDAGMYSFRIIYPEPGVSEFSVSGYTGTISETDKTITVHVPFGTNMDNLTPEVTAASGWTCTTTGEKDFNTSVEYGFTKDTVTQIYTVTVIPDGQGGIEIIPPPIDDITIEGFPTAPFTLSRGGTGGFLMSRTIILTSSGYSSIQWWIGETERTSSATNNGMTFVVQASAYTLGQHTIMVIVFKDGIPYSNEVDFTVVP